MPSIFLPLKNLELISGDDGKFYPTDEITRGQAAKIIANAFTIGEKLQSK
ncbi:MAG: S-layer homology domain-containing protein [Candidatus Ancillula trichonymphae]|nr:S-layer homology domain-containing protein [Candidatus Ancillula trichonymphae]